jgi:RHS repeat-associated protein
LTTTAQNQPKFTGYFRDDLGTTQVDYAINRYFASSSARFLSVGPGPSDPAVPQVWNRYSYALNDPINVFDVAGLSPCGFVSGRGAVSSMTVCAAPISSSPGSVAPPGGGPGIGIGGDISIGQLLNGTEDSILPQPGQNLGSLDPQVALNEAVSLAKSVLLNKLSCLQALTASVPIVPSVAGYPDFANPTITIDPVSVIDSVDFKVGDPGAGNIARHGGPLGFWSRMLSGEASVVVAEAALKGDLADDFGVATGFGEYDAMIRKRAFVLLHEAGHEVWYRAFLVNPVVGFLGNRASDTTTAKQNLADACFK